MTNFTTSLSLSYKGRNETFKSSSENSNLPKPINKSDQLKQIIIDRNKEAQRALELRIKQREKEEARKERELILNGKIRPTEAQVKSDKILQIYERVRLLNEKPKSGSDFKPKLKTASKWQRTAMKLTSSSSSFKSLPMFPDQREGEESMAKLNREEKKERKIFVRENPIHKSFAEAKTVDDLYKIADFWLSRSNAASVS